jgi:hypothetical protein
MAKTIGVSGAAALAAGTDTPEVTMTSTFSRENSVATSA